MGERDTIVSNQWTLTAKKIYEELGANVSFNPNPKFGHWMPLDTGMKINTFMMENLPGTGFNAARPFDPTPVKNWRETGFFNKFDQSMYTDGQSIESIGMLGIREWGFYYIPEACLNATDCIL